MNKFVDYMNNSRINVEKYFDKYFEQNYNDEFIDEAYKELDRMNKDGKRIRATLIKLGQEISNNTKYNPIDLCAAFEMFQTSVLIHDDIIDNSDYRRKKETIHHMYGGHEGVSKAICYGDLGFFLTYDLINKADYDAKTKIKLINLITEVFIKTVQGEIIDVALPYKNNFNEKKLEGTVNKIYTYKTAWYTISGPLALGAILGDADQNLINELIEIGKYLGIAFQIHDDLLGIYGNEKTIGKSVTSDIEEKKQTILYAHFINNGDEDMLKKFNKIYGSKDITDKDLEQIRSLFVLSKSKEYAETNKAMSLEKGKKIIVESKKISNDNKEILLDLVEYLLTRKY